MVDGKLLVAVLRVCAHAHPSSSALASTANHCLAISSCFLCWLNAFSRSSNVVPWSCPCSVCSR
jgi:hypothetical protein